MLPPYSFAVYEYMFLFLWLYINIWTARVNRKIKKIEKISNKLEIKFDIIKYMMYSKKKKEVKYDFL